MMYVSNLFFVI